MKKIIHHLRKQPEEVRRSVLYVSMFAMAVIMAILWVLSLGNSFTDSDLKVKIKQDLQPFSVLKDNIVEGYESNPDTDSFTIE